ncbi:hypothetical protein JK635_06370, partial [Neobacillus sp. YIM B02564]|nr:hypothetical protein [Neobacillus paridis]
MRRALDIAAQIRAGDVSALDVLADTEALIGARDPVLNCFTSLCLER